MTIVRRKQTPYQPPPAPPHSVRSIRTPRGLQPMGTILAELDDYVAVLAGDKEPPFDNGLMTLYEVANAYYGRACEIEGLIYRGERSGEIPRGSEWMKFRTGELVSYLNLFRHADRLGSRRLTAATEWREDPLD